jgi:hypothetical protein
MSYITIFLHRNPQVFRPDPPALLQGATKPRGFMTPMAAQEAATAEAMVTRGDVM